jgi:ketosteroid isomerase-like protein
MNLEIVRKYLAAIEAGAPHEALAAFFAPDVVQEEFPNRFVPDGARRDLAGLLAASERGRKVIRSQRYEILNALESGSTVALEVHWTGTLAVPVGTLPAGGDMRARFAVFIEVRDGKIFRQRNYDCFEPF